MVTALLALSLTVSPGYDEARQALAARRDELSAVWRRDRAKARAEARRALLDYLDDGAFPAWSGTPWAFYGTTTTPKEGAIACGYFVTTVLEQAHFKLERVKLAQQASAYLVSTLARGSKVEWLRPKDAASALADMKARFPEAQLLVVGFDLHVGFVRLDGDRAAFCHSSYLEPGVVTCEDPLTAGAFVSSLYVVSDTLTDALLDDWLLGRDVPSVLPKRPRRS
ncbi:MAG: hypothetical protein JNJ54_31390 [Myxococcaceae bacterium]|nr:hypothetical protein [Myxococcaceae bacterium]